CALRLKSKSRSGSEKPNPGRSTDSPPACGASNAARSVQFVEEPPSPCTYTATPPAPGVRRTCSETPPMVSVLPGHGRSFGSNAGSGVADNGTCVTGARLLGGVFGTVSVINPACLSGTGLGEAWVPASNLERVQTGRKHDRDRAGSATWRAAAAHRTAGAVASRRAARLLGQRLP